MSVPVSGLQEQEAIQEAWNRVLAWRQGGEVCGEPSLRAILQALVLAAQVSALESMAKEGCDFCKRWEAPKFTEIQRGGRSIWRWRHVFEGGSYLCNRGEVWDSVARLREAGLGSEPGEETAK